MTPPRNARGTARRVPTAGTGNSTSTPYVPVNTTPSGVDDLAAQSDAAELRRGGDTRPWHSVAVGDLVLHARTPLPAALHAFQAAVSPHNRSERLRQELTAGFVARHLRPDSYEMLLVAMIDPTRERVEITDVLEALTTLGTARPFVRSRASR